MVPRGWLSHFSSYLLFFCSQREKSLAEAASDCSCKKRLFRRCRYRLYKAKSGLRSRRSKHASLSLSLLFVGLLLLLLLLPFASSSPLLRNPSIYLSSSQTNAKGKGRERERVEGIKSPSFSESDRAGIPGIPPGIPLLLCLPPLKAPSHTEPPGTRAMLRSLLRAKMDVHMYMLLGI